MSASFKFNCVFKPSPPFLLFPYHKLVILGLKLKLCLSSSSISTRQNISNHMANVVGVESSSLCVWKVSWQAKKKTENTAQRWLKEVIKIKKENLWNLKMLQWHVIIVVESLLGWNKYEKNEKIIFEARNPLARSHFFTLTHRVTYIAQQRRRQATIGRQAMSERVKDGDDRS